MRDKEIRAQLEAIAMRGAGWGQLVSLPQADGAVLTTRVSIAGMMRRLASERLNQSYPPRPRADKGVAYVGGGRGLQGGRHSGTPRRIVRAAA